MVANRQSGNRAVFALVLLTALIGLVYSNTFKSPWHLDDYPNIVHNTNLHVADLTPARLVQTFFDARGTDPERQGRLYRPMANLTLALNWHWGGNDPFTYHLVNLAIHLLTAFGLYLTILVLLDAPRVRSGYLENKHAIALLAAVLWAINPIHTQAVTYIVQRMAALAAFFYLLGIYTYVRGRSTSGRWQRAGWLGGVFLSFVAAVGCKENAVTLPLALILIEYLFYQDANPLQQKGRFFKKAVITILGVVFIGIVLLSVFRGNPLEFIQQRYSDRPFTLAERVLTEPRILVLYLSQIFYPNPQRLSLMHDIQVSTGLVQPWTTLPAILLVGVLIAVGFLQARSRPLVALGLLFYFLNHLVESTVLPLELIFEHRNYLPTLFLFLPVAVGCHMLMARLHERNRYVFMGALVCLAAIIAVVGIGTYSRNMVWRTEKALWQDVLVKAPGLARPYQKLAAIYDRQGRTGEAAGLYKHAMGLKDPRPEQSRALSLNNLGNIYSRQQKYDQAIQMFETVLVLNPDHARARYNLSLALIGNNQLARALHHAHLLVASQNDNVRFLNLAGFLHIHQGQPDKALTYLQQALHLAPESRNTLINLGTVFKDLGRHAKADWYFNRARQLYPGDDVTLVRLVENALLAGDRVLAQRYAQALLKRQSLVDIERLFVRFQKDTRLLPIDAHLLKPFLTAEIRQQGAALVCPERAD